MGAMHAGIGSDRMGRGGMGCDGMGSDGPGRDGMRWGGIGWTGEGWDAMVSYRMGGEGVKKWLLKTGREYFFA